MNPNSNQKILEEFRQIRDEIIETLNKDIGKRVESIEKTLYLGNGKPSITSRVSSMESNIENISEKLDSILENTILIPVMRSEVESVKDWQKTKDNIQSSLRIEKWGGIYQAVGAVVTMVLGTVIGIYFSTPSDAMIQEAVQKALNKAEPVKVFEVNHK